MFRKLATLALLIAAVVNGYHAALDLNPSYWQFYGVDNLAYFAASFSALGYTVRRAVAS